MGVFQAVYIWYSVESVLKATSVALIGVWLSRKGYLSKTTRYQVSKIIYLVLIPAFTFVNVAEATSSSQVSQYWPLVVVSMIHHTLGAFLGYFITKITSCPLQ
eukprot:Sdes_comp22820_c0_seq1m21207